jgi:hypothetical protein
MGEHEVRRGGRKAERGHVRSDFCEHENSVRIQVTQHKSPQHVRILLLYQTPHEQVARAYVPN